MPNVSLELKKTLAFRWKLWNLELFAESFLTVRRNAFTVLLEVFCRLSAKFEYEKLSSIEPLKKALT